VGGCSTNLSHKAYVNALGSEGKERGERGYGENYTRLVELKRRYDPNNLFRMNQNISPE
jgi:FAD/FMN-containing dehydrogenase